MWEVHRFYHAWAMPQLEDSAASADAAAAAGMGHAAVGAVMDFDGHCRFRAVEAGAAVKAANRQMKVGHAVDCLCLCLGQIGSAVDCLCLGHCGLAPWTTQHGILDCRFRLACQIYDRLFWGQMGGWWWIP